MKKTVAKKTTARKPAAKKTASKAGATSDRSAAKQIDAKIKELGDWRGETLGRLRALIHEAVPGVTETVKWGGVPVFEQDGIICTGETYKAVVKLTFAKGASLKDPKGLFNSSLEGNVRRALDIRQGDKLNEAAFKGLIREAVDLNSKKNLAKGKKSKS